MNVGTTASDECHDLCSLYVEVTDPQQQVHSDQKSVMMPAQGLWDRWRREECESEMSRFNCKQTDRHIHLMKVQNIIELFQETEQNVFETNKDRETGTQTHRQTDRHWDSLNNMTIAVLVCTRSCTFYAHYTTHNINMYNLQRHSK